MKKILLTIVALTFMCTACTKDGANLIDPANNTGINEAFGKATQADQFLLNIYRQILEVLSHTDSQGARWRSNSLLDVGDENLSGNGQTAANVREWNSGATTSSSTGVFSYADWQNNYSAIRACLIYLEHIKDVPVDASANFTEPTRVIRIAEAKWLLAFNYAELAKEFGGVPIVKTVYDPAQDLTLARSTYDETIAYIVGLCDEAAAALPDKYALDGDYGRATKGAALALKARMLLYAASPLWNDSSNPTDTYASGKYDATKWQKAAAAAQDVIAMNKYQLHTDISTLFTTRTNNEIIYARMQEPMSYWTATNVPYTLYTAVVYPLGGYNQVTYNQLKQYEVLKSGVAYSVDDAAAATAGYSNQDPYKNRDPRFYRDCIFNGAAVQGKTAEFGELAPGFTGKVIKHNFPSLTSALAFYTHVFCSKFCDLTLPVTTNDPRTPGNNARTNQNYIYLRYAEVLLNFAEAANEAYGPEVVPPGGTISALNAVNQVRTRAAYVAGKPEYLGLTGSMPPIPSGLSKDAFRTKLQHERRVELAFEEHYFWDFRRWKQTPETVVQAQVPVWTSATNVTYQIKNIDTRVFSPKMNRMPIPNADILTNPKLQQNPGW